MGIRRIYMEKKHIVLGVCGGIAAYKACDLVSRLSKKNYEIKVVLTKNAAQFVSPLTFETLSHNTCELDTFDFRNEDPIAHITLAKWADAIVIVPATANMIAKVCHGLADDLLSTTFLAAYCPKIICPAMNVHMYENQTTQNNIQLAKQLGYAIIEPETGLLACKDTGKGKLASNDTIVAEIDKLFEPPHLPLKGKKVVVTAGPTQEALDPVRFISNHSSGKQGYAIAKAAKALGANVSLVHGPVQLADLDDVNMISIQSALDMFEVMKEETKDADYIIMSAAVADYRPKVISEQKMKKNDECMQIEFVKNPDILAYLGAHKSKKQILCGFAMETENLVHNARKKLESKNCDMLIANNLFTKGAGFKTDTNVVTLLLPDQNIELEPCTKEKLGYIILQTMQDIEERRI